MRNLKTTAITKLFIRTALAAGGPHKVAAVTYTRAAAQELKLRVAESLGIPTDPESLSKSMPWVGTVHSLAYRLSGRPRMADEKKAYAALGGTRASFGRSEMDFYERFDEPSLALRLEASARQRLQTPYDALGTLPLEGLASTTPERLFNLIDQYRTWKQDTRVKDYEDLLLMGRKHAPPVQVFIMDEAQDASPLLWSVADAWMAGTSLAVFAGDPWQTLYQFSGASPTMFRQRPGTWTSLKVSHRLTPRSVAYAKSVLTGAGWADPLFDTWDGAGAGVETDSGTRFLLARTHDLVRTWERHLIDRAIPFYRLGEGKSPLQQESKNLWLACQRLLAQEPVPAGSLLELAKYDDPKKDWVRDCQKNPDAPVTFERFHDMTRGMEHHLISRIPWTDYYKRVVQQHGVQALFDTPKISLGTGHASKGLEADHVEILAPWGSIPLKSLETQEGARNEACTAFVACSRHRQSLTIVHPDFVPRSRGDYPFPGGLG